MSTGADINPREQLASIPNRSLGQLDRGRPSARNWVFTENNPTPDPITRRTQLRELLEGTTRFGIIGKFIYNSSWIIVWPILASYIVGLDDKTGIGSDLTFTSKVLADFFQ